MREECKEAQQRRLARREARKGVEKVMPQSDVGCIVVALESIAARLSGGDDSKVIDLLDAFDDIKLVFESLARRLDVVEDEQRVQCERKSATEKDPVKCYMTVSDVEQMIETAIVVYGKKSK